MKKIFPIFLLCSVSACVAPIIPQQKSGFNGIVGGVRGSLQIEKVASVYSVDLEAHGGSAGSGTVRAPAEVFLEVVDRPAKDANSEPGIEFVRPISSAEGLVPPSSKNWFSVWNEARGLNQNGSLPATTRFGPNIFGSVIATDYEVFEDDRGSPCRLQIRVDSSGHANVTEYSCSLDRTPNLNFTGSLD